MLTLHNQRFWHVYVGTYQSAGEESIRHLVFDSQAGSLREDVGISGAERPSFLATDTERNRLYAVCEIDEPQVVGYLLNPQSGVLEEINRQPIPGMHACHVSLHPSGDWLYVANYSSGNICLFPIDEEGRLGPLADQQEHSGSGPREDRQDGPHTHSIVTEPWSGRLLVPDLGTDRIYVYDLDRLAGKLRFHGEAVAPAGAGPRHLAFHASSPIVYCADELSSSVSAYKYRPEDGSLTLLQTISTLPDDGDPATNTCGDIHISMCGGLLYVSNRGHDSLATFRIGEDGELTLIGCPSVQGQTPRNFAVVPDGRHVLVANQDTDSIIVMALDEEGVPAPQGERFETDKPVCLKLIPVME
ncbi:lactonase family protein [Paenibacillus daejeonensis]|uniref:lactonase family protein n=1 Tax=Paenibacillus daejeonensis TaxID=135193 RepID=UPI00035C21C9|nr:lactonase family protein [Paenibacillus daejeonensis]